MDESEYRGVVEWFCKSMYYNLMLTQCKEACNAHPTSDHLRILLCISQILNGQFHEAGKEIAAMSQGVTSLAALVLQTYIHRQNGNRSGAAQVDSAIREEKRKASFATLYLAAVASFFTRKVDKAKDFAERASKINSNDGDLLIVRGWIELYLARDKKTDKPVNHFEAVLKENSRNVNALMGAAKFKEYNGDHSGAITILNSLIVRYPKMCYPLVEKMNNQVATKDWEQAMETSNRILTLEANNVDALKLKTVAALCRESDSGEGLKQLQLFYRNSILAEPKNVSLFVDNTQLFARISQGNREIIEELVKFSNKMSQQNPNRADLMVELGNLYVTSGNVKDAEHWFRETVRIDESSFAALMGLAHCQLLDKSPGSSELARQQMDFLMELQSQSLNAETMFMSARLNRHDASKALYYINKAMAIALERCAGVSFGYEYLKRLNPLFAMQVVKEYLSHYPNIAADDSTADSTHHQESEQVVSLLGKITDACPNLSEAFLTLATLQMQSNNYEEALVPLRKLLDSVDPANATGHLLMAQILARQGSYQLASQSLEVGLSYNFKVRDDPMYHLIVGMVEKENGNYDKCIASFRQAMIYAGLKPGNHGMITPLSTTDKATLYLEMISAYGKAKRLEEAVSFIEEAKIQLSGTAEEARIKIGHADFYMEMGEYDKAIVYLAEVKPNERYYLQAHVKLAEIQLKYRKDRQEFSKCFRELVEHCPGAKTYSMLGDAYVMIQEPERAIDVYEEALRETPNDMTLVRKMGKALIKTHQYDRAINYYQTVIQQGKCPDLKLDMAELYMKMKKYSSAETALTEEIQENRLGTDLESLELRGKQLLLLAEVRKRDGNLNGAMDTLKEAKDNATRCMQRVTVVGNSTDHNAVLNEICLSMADNSSALRDYNQAIAYFKEALTYKPTDTKALLSLAKIYMQINDVERCSEHCSALLNADPNNEAASVMMADLAFRNVDFGTAAYHFRQLLLRHPTYWTALARLIEVSRRTGDMQDIPEWLERAEEAMANGKHEAGYDYCYGLYEWRMGRLNSALQKFNHARRDPEWGQQAIYNMIEICLDPDDDTTLASETYSDDYDDQDNRSMALKTAERFLKELNPKGSVHEMLTHCLLTNFYLIATKQKSSVEKAIKDCTELANSFRDHVGPALALATANILLKQPSRARNHLKLVANNVWTFEDAEYLERCWLLLAEIYIQNGKTEVATNLLKKVLEHNAMCSRAHELLGNILEKDQHYRDAAQRYSHVWKYKSKVKLAVGYKLAYCYMKAKMYADAIDVCNELLANNPDFPRVKKDILEKCINHLRT